MVKISTSINVVKYNINHKYYKTDKGQGKISSTDEYSKFYSCDTKKYI